MSDYESALLETWQRKPDAIPVLLSDNLWKEREIAALREQLATTASDGEQTCSACEQLGQAPSPDHLASVAPFSADVAQLVETQLLRERITELAEANDALERVGSELSTRPCRQWSRLPLLQARQAAIRFPSSSVPPLAFGVTWSTVVAGCPQ